MNRNERVEGSTQIARLHYHASIAGCCGPSRRSVDRDDRFVGERRPIRSRPRFHERRLPGVGPGRSPRARSNSGGRHARSESSRRRSRRAGRSARTGWSQWLAAPPRFLDRPNRQEFPTGTSPDGTKSVTRWQPDGAVGPRSTVSSTVTRSAGPDGPAGGHPPADRDVGVRLDRRGLDGLTPTGRDPDLAAHGFDRQRGQLLGGDGHPEGSARFELNDLALVADLVGEARRLERAVCEHLRHESHGVEGVRCFRARVRFDVGPEPGREWVAVRGGEQRHQRSRCGDVRGRAADLQPGLVGDSLAIPFHECRSDRPRGARVTEGRRPETEHEAFADRQIRVGRCRPDLGQHGGSQSGKAGQGDDPTLARLRLGWPRSSKGMPRGARR